MATQPLRDEPLRAAPKPSPDKVTHKRASARGKYAEKRVAEVLGGRRTAFSGAGREEKGDVRVENLPVPLFVEVKYVGERQGKAEGSVTFPRAWAEKTILDAQAAGAFPVVAIRFRDGAPLYVTTAEVFEALVHQLQEYYGRVCEPSPSPSSNTSGAPGRSWPSPEEAIEVLTAFVNYHRAVQ